MLISFLVENFIPIMFINLVFILLSGFPVAFSLAATGLVFGILGITLGIFPSTLFQVLPLRIFGIMQNETLLAIPFFTLMGIILERSGMAEDLLETVGVLFGDIRGGLAISVILVGALLAASTGVTSAVVISMGLISLPIMNRYGYKPEITSGVITAAGAMVQALPPSLVLIVMADQLGRSVGDLYKAALGPGFLLIGLYIAFIAFIAVIRPKWVPALPASAQATTTHSGKSGRKSLFYLVLICSIIGFFWAQSYNEVIAQSLYDVSTPAPRDEILISTLTVASISALLLAGVNKIAGLNLLSNIAERFVFALIPPIILIFLVLGTIFLGIATPTEGGAMGALGALILAFIRGRLSWGLLSQALTNTSRLATFVLFILIGSTVFSFTFSAADGNLWVENLFAIIPGGQLGFIITVCIIIFFLGMFLDFFEIAFIVIPLLVPVAETMGIDLVWFGIIIALVLQTSFLTPPFGFALLYLRSVAPKNNYFDKVINKELSGIQTKQIWKGSFYFVCLQLIVVIITITWPQLTLSNLNNDPVLNNDEVLEQLENLSAFTNEFH